MTLKETLVADLKATLEETSNIMADRIILESLAKNGSVSLNEAEFYDSLVRRVVTESAEEFVPETLNMPLQEGEMPDFGGEEEEAPVAELPPAAPGEAMKLTGEDGTIYNFDPATCELTPVDGAEGSEEAQDGLDAIISNDAGIEDSKEPFGESTEVDADADVKVLEESEGVQELTESQMIVSNLIKSLGA